MHFILLHESSLTQYLLTYCESDIEKFEYTSLSGIFSSVYNPSRDRLHLSCLCQFSFGFRFLEKPTQVRHLQYLYVFERAEGWVRDIYAQIQGKLEFIPTSAFHELTILGQMLQFQLEHSVLTILILSCLPPM